MEWGSFQYKLMPFGLKNAPTVFSRVVVVEFKDFTHKFLELYLDDWMMLKIKYLRQVFTWTLSLLPVHGVTLLVKIKK